MRLLRDFTCIRFTEVTNLVTDQFLLEFVNLVGGTGERPSTIDQVLSRGTHIFRMFFCQNSLYIPSLLDHIFLYNLLPI